MKTSAIPQPKQQRSQKTVNGILDAAATLLASHGFEGMNTNAIAKHAATNIATLYKYFPDKYAILQALLERFSEALLAMVFAEVQASNDKTLRTEIILKKIMTTMREQPWLQAVLESFKSSPTLREIYDNYCSSIAEQLTVFFPSPKGAPTLKKQQVTCIIRLLIEVISNGLILVLTSPKQQRNTLFTELCHLVNSYLAIYRN